jgi:hypothetical protein
VLPARILAAKIFMREAAVADWDACEIFIVEPSKIRAGPIISSRQSRELWPALNASATSPQASTQDFLNMTTTSAQRDLRRAKLKEVFSLHLSEKQSNKIATK